MTLTWPWALLSLLAIPVLVAAYRRLLVRQSGRRAQLAAEGLVLARPGRERLRHLAPALLIAALAVMLLALTRPVAAVAEPHRQGTVILAFDVSTSMAATDVTPSRLESAKAAAKGFVDKQPPAIKIGVVAFGGTGLVAQQPTTDKTAVMSAVARLKPEGDTSLGQGLLASLSAIAGKPIVVPRTPGNGPAATPGASPSTGTGGGSSLDDTAIGYYGGTAVILLTDGENTGGTDPAQVADLASAAGVHVYPIGLGSPQGTVVKVDGFSISTALDEPALQQIAATTGGTYFNATDAASLSKVYDSVQLTWTTKTVPHEVTSLVAGFAALLLLAGAIVSVLRSGRVV
ncbi:VWA domain-containing protein [Lapillicoccus sp.]|uniref:vWA domain-containing protein n=1 Tax=Lapillicoccus sp. TaxID=1909287 RepID=UPI0025DF5340|nr:VWA domain-containing protein [Lapillicoccus sp.]